MILINPKLTCERTEDRAPIYYVYAGRYHMGFFPRYKEDDIHDTSNVPKYVTLCKFERTNNRLWRQYYYVGTFREFKRCGIRNKYVFRYDPFSTRPHQ